MRTNLPTLLASFKPSLPDLEQIRDTDWQAKINTSNIEMSVMVCWCCCIHEISSANWDISGARRCAPIFYCLHVRLAYFATQQATYETIPTFTSNLVLVGVNQWLVPNTYQPCPPKIKIMSSLSLPRVNTISVGEEVPPRPQGLLSQTPVLSTTGPTLAK